MRVIKTALDVGLWVAVVAVCLFAFMVVFLIVDEASTPHVLASSTTEQLPFYAAQIAQTEAPSGLLWKKIPRVLYSPDGLELVLGKHQAKIYQDDYFQVRLVIFTQPETWFGIRGNRIHRSADIDFPFGPSMWIEGLYRNELILLGEQGKWQMYLRWHTLGQDWWEYALQQ